MHIIALIDTRSELPGETIGTVIGTHGTIAVRIQSERGISADKQFLCELNSLPIGHALESLALNALRSDSPRGRVSRKAMETCQRSAKEACQFAGYLVRKFARYLAYVPFYLRKESALSSVHPTTISSQLLASGAHTQPEGSRQIVCKKLCQIICKLTNKS